MSLDLYARLTEAAVRLDRGLGLAQVSGPDRVSWLQGMVTNDVGRLRPGEGCYAAFLSPQGKVVSLMVILAEEDALWLVTDRDNVARTVEELDKLLIMEDAAITDCSSEHRILSVVGAEARSVMEQNGFDLAQLDTPYAHTRADGVLSVRAEIGYDLIVPGPSATQWEERLNQAGAWEGEEDLWNVIRIEMGCPRFGVDADGTTTFPELGEQGIDYDKGCYIGQEVVAKIKYIGHVNRRLIGLRLESSPIPEPNAAVRVDDRDVGRVTSAVWSPALENVVALAMLRTGAAKVGMKVEVEVTGGFSEGWIVELPFVRHAY